MEKKKIYKVKVIDVLFDDVVESYQDCDFDKVVSLLLEFNGYPRKLIITSAIS